MPRKTLIGWLSPRPDYFLVDIDPQMNFCLITPYYRSLNNDQGGVGSHYTDLVNSISKYCRTVFLIYVAPESLDKETISSLPKNVRYYWIDDRSSQLDPNRKQIFLSRWVKIMQNLEVARTVMRLHSKHRLDFIETTNYSYLLLLYSLVPYAVPLTTRISTTRAQLAKYEGKRAPFSVQDFLESSMVKRSHIKLTHTLIHANELADLLKIPLKSLAIIPHGTSLPEDINTRCFQNSAEVLFLFVGRFEHRKGIDVLIDSIPALLSKYPNLYFRIAGDPGDTEYEKNFRMLHPEWIERVLFLGPIDNDSLQVEYSNCDALVAPSRYESFGLIYIEAMAHGKPVIGCTAGGIPEVVADGETGLLANPGDSLDLTQKISILMDSPESSARMGQAARKRVERLFDSQKLGERSYEMFESFAQEPNI